MAFPVRRRASGIPLELLGLVTPLPADGGPVPGEIVEHQDGPWRAGVPESGAGRWCDVFEIRDYLIQRCFIYLDPDYAGRDTARYPWLKAEEHG